MGHVGGGSEFTQPKIETLEEAKTEFRKYIAGHYTTKTSSDMVDHHPALQMAHKFEIAEFLWDKLGISWSELDEMDPADIEKILEIYRIRIEINGPDHRCPMG